jgi:hypothetical protein
MGPASLVLGGLGTMLLGVQSPPLRTYLTSPGRSELSATETVLAYLKGSPVKIIAVIVTFPPGARQVGTDSNALSGYILEGSWCRYGKHGARFISLGTSGGGHEGSPQRKVPGNQPGFPSLAV